jgi:hypothetical protein
MQTIPKRSMRDRFNGVRAVFVNPDNNWQPGDAPPLVPSAALLLEDNGDELYEDMRFPFVTSARQVQRLMKIHLQRNRRQKTVSFPAKLTAMRLTAWDGVYISNERYEWVSEQFRVMGWMLAEDGGIDLQLQEDDSTVYDWTSVEELPLSLQQEVTKPDASNIASPTPLQVIAPTTLTFTRVVLEWPEVKSFWLDGYDVEHKSAGFSDWSSYGRVDKDGARRAPVERSVNQDFRVRAVTRNGTPSIWAEAIAPGPPIITATVTPGEISWTNGTLATRVQIFKDGVHFEEISATPALRTGLGDGTYQFRSLSAERNFSVLSNTTTLTTAGPGGDPGDGSDDGGDGGDDGGDGGDGGDGE